MKPFHINSIEPSNYVYQNSWRLKRQMATPMKTTQETTVEINGSHEIDFGGTRRSSDLSAWISPKDLLNPSVLITKLFEFIIFSPLIRISLWPELIVPAEIHHPFVFTGSHCYRSADHALTNARISPYARLQDRVVWLSLWVYGYTISTGFQT